MAFLLIAALITGFIVFIVAGAVVLTARDQRGSKDKD
jgi:hypothetical protein